MTEENKTSTDEQGAPNGEGLALNLEQGGASASASIGVDESGGLSANLTVSEPLANFRTLDAVRGLPEVGIDVRVRKPDFAEGSIQRFKAEDGRTMLVAQTDDGFAAIPAAFVETQVQHQHV